MNGKLGMRRISRWTGLLVLIAILASAAGTSAAPIRASNAPPDPRVTTPLAYFGYNLGDDYKLTPWETRVLEHEGMRNGILNYYQELQRTSNRVRVFPNGVSEEGRPLALTIITAPENWAQIDKIKTINKKLADPRQIASDDEAKLLAQQGKAVYWLNAGIHATERTGLETLTRLAYQLASDRDEWTTSLLKDVIVVIEGTNNPDGAETVTDWYYHYFGTPYEGSSPPYYNKYNSHDDNRDFVSGALVESQNSVQPRFEWYPIMYTDLHQAQDLLYVGMPPDPINPAVSPIEQGEMMSMSGYVITEMIAQGYKGVFTYDYADMWYPGYNHGFTFMHNGAGSWWELTGVTYASPRTITSGNHAGKRTWFNPAPYSVPLEYHLINAMNMQGDAIRNSLTWTMRNKVDLLFNFYLKGKTNMQNAASQAPYAFVIPAAGGDNFDVTDLVNTLVTFQHIEVDRATAPFVADGQQFAAGDYVVGLDQPYGLTAKVLLTKQDFPINALDPRNRTSTYDYQAWTMGLMHDVNVVALNSPLPTGLGLAPVTAAVPFAGALVGAPSTRYVLENGTNNNLAVALPKLWGDADFAVSQVDAAFTAGGRSFPAGTFIVTTNGSQAVHNKFKTIVEGLGLAAYAISENVTGVALHQPKVGLYKPNTSTMPEGWTRLRFDRTGFPYTSLSFTLSEDLSSYDVVVIASQSTNSIVNGSTSSSFPPELRGGIGDAGVAKLLAFVQNGGTLVLLGSATRLPIDKGWAVGVSLGAGTPPTCKGSILRAAVDPTAKVAYGYDQAESVWFNTSDTPFLTVPAGSPAQVVASYPNDGQPLLLSGYINDDSVLKGKAAIVDAPLGSGNVVLITNDVLFRAQATGTFNFFWNALLEGAR